MKHFWLDISSFLLHLLITYNEFLLIIGFKLLDSVDSLVVEEAVANSLDPDLDSSRQGAQ